MGMQKRLMKMLAGVALVAGVAAPMAAAAQDTQSLILAGGCFWCIEHDFEKVAGVVDVQSGYAGGTVENPTYEQVTAGGTGHYEVVQVVYDADVISTEEILHAFWRSVDPTDAGGQFCDRGDSYRTAVFGDSAQRAIAETSKQAAAEALGQEIVTPILDAATFYPAEGYHQDYAERNAVRYNFYRWSCGRNQRVDALWGDMAYDGIKS